MREQEDEREREGEREQNNGKFLRCSIKVHDAMREGREVDEKATIRAHIKHNLE